MASRQVGDDVSLELFFYGKTQVKLIEYINHNHRFCNPESNSLRPPSHQIRRLLKRYKIPTEIKSTGSPLDIYFHERNGLPIACFAPFFQSNHCPFPMSLSPARLVVVYYYRPSHSGIGIFFSRIPQKSKLLHVTIVVVKLLSTDSNKKCLLNTRNIVSTV